MGTNHPEFAPLEPERAKELETIINTAAKNKEAVVIDPERGVTASMSPHLISPNENTNGMVRYRRHYGV